MSQLQYSFFFFSSRRRHTRCGRDWSSDVCSSDLLAGIGINHIDHAAKHPYTQQFTIGVQQQVASNWLISADGIHNFGQRSEEHTSELQSRPHLVCRLLLEKKKNGKTLRLRFNGPW